MSYTVKSISEAWKIADDIFPTDYIQDPAASDRAGYPIYKSTAAGVNAWISDLNSRLEVNLPDGQSINIWIDAPAVVTVLEVKAEEIMPGVYSVPVANGDRITVATDVIYNGNCWKFKVDSQYFDNCLFAKRYLLRRMQEKLTGVRYLPRKYEIPEICGVNGIGCRNRNCNSMLCSNCPIAEKYYADKDGIKEIVYLQ